MNRITYLECRVMGHKNACAQEATLLPEGGGFLDHTHTCLRCDHVHVFETEELPPEVEQMLRSTLWPTSQRVTVLMPSDPHIH